MKVLLSAFQCSPIHGSEMGNAWNWAKTLSELGHDVTVLTLSSYRDRVMAAGPHAVDFRFIDLPHSLPMRAPQRMTVYSDYLRWQKAILDYVTTRRQTFDVAHHVTWGSLRLGSELWRLPVPLVYGPIGGAQVAPPGYWRYLGRGWPAERLRRTLSGPLLPLNVPGCQAIRHSAVTLVTNSATGEAARRIGARDIRFMLADGLSTDWLGSARVRPAGTPVVLWVGRMIPCKAPVLAVRAFAALRRRIPARLIMAGDGPLYGQVRNSVQRLGLSADVDLAGWIPWDEVRRRYDSASALLFTSLRDSFGAQFLEALGRGLPAVAIDQHGIADVDVGAAAVKVPLPAHPRELPGAIATALEEVLSDDAWESRSAAAVRWAGESAWPAKAATVTRVYHEAVSTLR